MWVVGLGNPGPSYEETRHNVGRDFVAYLSETNAVKFSHRRQAEILRLPSFFAARLSCFMNESGGPVKALMLDQEIPAEQLLVVVDDFMIPFGTIRLRPGGSSGGHNGLKSIISALGTDQFPRLRVGVGPVREFQDPADFVLERFSKTERTALPVMYKAIEDTIAKIESDGMEKAMNWTNKSHLQ
jgi:PTH1 family peptidyl-tRNA hydrolase